MWHCHYSCAFAASHQLEPVWEHKCRVSSGKLSWETLDVQTGLSKLLNASLALCVLKKLKCVVFTRYLAVPSGLPGNGIPRRRRWIFWPWWLLGSRPGSGKTCLAPPASNPRSKLMVENTTDPCLRIGTFPELDPQTLDLKKQNPTLWFVIVSVQQQTTKFLYATLD